MRIQDGEHCSGMQMNQWALGSVIGGPQQSVLAMSTRSRTAAANGKWTEDEDEALRRGVAACGPKNWRAISEQYLKGQRTDVQCLHRWNKVSCVSLAFGRLSHLPSAVHGCKTMPLVHRFFDQG